MISNIPKKTLAQFVDNTATCFNYTGYIDKTYDDIAVEKKHITVGFGFVSHNDGLSEHVPIDIYTMLLTTEKIRREVLVEDAKVHILIGDHFAFQCPHPSCNDKEAVTKIRQKYFKKLNSILTHLGVKDHYVFHLSSDIVNEANYKRIRSDLDNIDPANVSKDTQNILNEKIYTSSNKNYFLDQTALFQYLFAYHDCGIKVSWAKKGNKRGIERSVSFDEPHFDRFYRDLYGDIPKLSFIYTQSGFATNKQDEHSKVIPYTAAPKKDITRILLSAKQGITHDYQIENKKLEEILIEHTKIAKDINATIEQKFAPKIGEGTMLYQNICFLRQLSKDPSKFLETQEVSSTPTASSVSWCSTF